MKIYMDHASTTPVDSEVVKAMLPYFTDKFGNASSIHSFGREAKKALDGSRRIVANALNANPDEIIFTSSGTESDNLAIKGIAIEGKNKGRNHIITSSIEHHAVLNPCEYLGENGFDITHVPVDRYGIVNPSDIENSITEKTCLISVMHANNEIGTIQQIEEIGKISKEHGIPFHTDAVQTFGKIPIDVEKFNITLLSISGHKIYGPKGIGALYIKKGTRIEPLIHGGGHERGLRSGTENISGIVGLGKAVEIAQRDMEKEAKRLTALRDILSKGVLEIKDSWLNGHPTKRLPNNANFCFSRVEGESMLLKLDAKGIAVSTGSACSSKSLEPSHVLKAIGLKPGETHGSLRFTLGKSNTKEDIDYVLGVLPEIVDELRRISPL